MKLPRATEKLPKMKEWEDSRNVEQKGLEEQIYPIYSFFKKV